MKFDAAWICALFLMLGAALPAAADPFEDGYTAFNEGRYEDALKLWLPLAGDGVPEAQNNVGYLYSEGLGMPVDHEEAARWYALAADQGNAGAQASLADMYYNGEGVAQDYRAAFRLYELAANQGNVNAQFNLAVMYRSGRGVEESLVQTLKWYAIAAAAGDTQAKEERDLLTAILSASELEEATILIRQWSPFTPTKTPPEVADGSYPLSAPVPFDVVHLAISAGELDPNGAIYERFALASAPSGDTAICGFVTFHAPNGTYSPYYPFYYLVNAAEGAAGYGYDSLAPETFPPAIALLEPSGCDKVLDVAVE